MGIRYLWVDALCIAQDDEIEKMKEIKRMGQIYKYARVTIAAASSPSVRNGFLKKVSSDDVPLPLVLSDGGYGTLWTRKAPAPPDEPLDKRGWALQEYLLSPRLLYYGSRDLIWKCQERLFEPVLPTRGIYSAMTFPQARFRLPPTVFDLTSQEATPVAHFWAWIQRAYCSRNLQLFDDRFRVLGGIQC